MAHEHPGDGPVTQRPALEDEARGQQRAVTHAQGDGDAQLVRPVGDVDGVAPSRLRIAIALRQDDLPLLATSLVLERRRLTDRAIARVLLRYPLVTVKTILAIHWHALRLWRRGIPFQRHAMGRADRRRRRAAPDPGRRRDERPGRDPSDDLAGPHCSRRPPSGSCCRPPSGCASVD